MYIHVHTHHVMCARVCTSCDVCTCVYICSGISSETCWQTSRVCFKKKKAIDHTSY